MKRLLLALVLMLMSTASALAQLYYLRPSADATTSATTGCYAGTNTASPSMSAIYSGKSGVGPVNPTTTLGNVLGYYSSGQTYEQRVFSGFQAATGTSTSLVLNVYLGAYRLGSGSGGCVYYSTNSGSTWTSMGTIPSTMSTLSVTITGATVSNVKVLASAYSGTASSNNYSIAIGDIWITETSTICPSSPCTLFSPGTWTWTVPSGVKSIQVSVAGAGGGGGGGGDCNSGDDGGSGGDGGYTSVSATGLSLEAGGGRGGGGGYSSSCTSGIVASGINGTDTGAALTFTSNGGSAGGYNGSGGSSGAPGNNGDYGLGIVSSTPAAVWTIVIGAGGGYGSGGNDGDGVTTDGSNGGDGYVTLTWSSGTPHAHVWLMSQLDEQVWRWHYARPEFFCL